jgi:hypothetical protein
MTIPFIRSRHSHNKISRYRNAQPPLIAKSLSALERANPRRHNKPLAGVLLPVATTYQKLETSALANLVVRNDFTIPSPITLERLLAV